MLAFNPNHAWARSTGASPIRTVSPSAAPTCVRSRSRNATSTAARCVHSEADGTYRIRGLTRARHGVAASAPGYLPVAFGEDDPLHTSLRLDLAPSVSGVDIVLVGGGVHVIGHVRDLLGGPVEGARVYVPRGPSAASVSTWSSTDADGSFSLWTTPGPVVVVAEADGYARASEIGNASDSPFALALAPESVLTGVVRTPAGGLVAGARVEALLEDVFALSDAQGRWSTLPARAFPEHTCKPAVLMATRRGTRRRSPTRAGGLRSWRHPQARARSPSIPTTRPLRSPSS